MFRIGRFLLLIPLAVGAVLWCTDKASAVDVVTIGVDGDLDWEGEGSAAVVTIAAEHRSPLDPNVLISSNAPGDLIEFSSPDFPGSLLPRRIEEGENIADGTLSRGGTIASPNVFDFSGTFSRLDLQNALNEIISSDEGGELLAFQRKDLNSLGILVILNMGARFGVDRIRFYPRNTVQSSPSTPFQEDFLRSFELFINDGLSLSKSGSQIWEPLVIQTDNKEPVVEITMDPPRFVQSVRLRSTSTIDFEIDEIEVFGEGFLARSQYISDIYDAGQPAVWGMLRWIEEALGDPKFSSLQIRTRTGSDPTPFVFTRVLSAKRDAEEIPFSLEDETQEMTLAEFKRLPAEDSFGRKWDPGPVKDDLINWSPFSTPYPADAANGPGVPITSPSPRRYFQFQVLFESNNLEAARRLGSLGFELLTPVLADEVVGEVFPREVPVSTVTPFTYALRVQMSTAAGLGFDTIEIATPIRVASIDGIEITDPNGQVVAAHTFAGLDDTVSTDGFRIGTVADDQFSVHFNLIEENDTIVKIRFQTEVLTYSTNFNAAIKLAAEPAVAQNIISGDVTSLDAGDIDSFSGTTVLSPSILGGRSLIDRFDLTPAVFSPNGDGINDRMGIQYNLLSLSTLRPVKIQVYDLKGRLLRTIHDGLELNGRYEDKTWDGLDDSGQPVAPGLYLVRIDVEGDQDIEKETRVVAVVY